MFVIWVVYFCVTGIRYNVHNSSVIIMLFIPQKIFLKGLYTSHYMTGWLVCRKASTVFHMTEIEWKILHTCFAIIYIQCLWFWKTVVNKIYTSRSFFFCLKLKDSVACLIKVKLSYKKKRTIQFNISKNINDETEWLTWSKEIYIPFNKFIKNLVFHLQSVTINSKYSILK